MLFGIAVDDSNHSVDCDCNEDERKGEEKDERDFAIICQHKVAGRRHKKELLPFEWHVRFEHNGYRKADEQQIRNHIARRHSQKLRKALPALCSRIWHNLPVVGEWLTLGQSRDDDGCKGDDEEVPYNLQAQLIRSFPHLAREALQEF